MQLSCAGDGNKGSTISENIIIGQLVKFFPVNTNNSCFTIVAFSFRCMAISGKVLRTVTNVASDCLMEWKFTCLCFHKWKIVLAQQLVLWDFSPHVQTHSV